MASCYFSSREASLLRKDSTHSTDSCVSGQQSGYESGGTAVTTPMSEQPPCKLCLGRSISPDTLSSSLCTIAAPPTRNICFVGAGFVGGPTAALIALHNSEIAVHVVDLNAARIAVWNSSHLPVHETGLSKVVRIARDGTRAAAADRLPAREPNLVFSTDVAAQVAMADIVFICVNTPTKRYGVGAGASADLGYFEAATVTIAKNVKPGAIVVEKSTVPCGTARMIASILEQYRPREHFEVLNNPEFLAEGTAVADLVHPDRILIGSAKTAGGMRAAVVLKAVYAAWVPAERLLGVDTFSSELAKLIANAMLAQRISSVNAVSALCEELGADVEAVSIALGADSRIGSRFLQAGIGFGGSCFEKDIRNVAYLARALRLDEVADYWMAVLQINAFQRERFARALVRRLHGSLAAKKIAIFGFAFKHGTNDTRNSVAVHVIAQLAAEIPREIAVFDPGCAVADIEAEIRAVVSDPLQRSRIRVYADWPEAVAGASAICILTAWEHFGMSKEAKSEEAPASRASLSLDQLPETLSEMDVVRLEQLHGDNLDPLHRLLPEPGCAQNCVHCTAADSMSEASPVNWEAAAAAMDESRWVFDGRNVVDAEYLESLGFKVHSIGRGYPMP
ncbi:udp-glucose 6-dehydrogenase [Grosmannia clavigera kw1407]|uniref:UDP-glucose 6-dehydrogenase n=1 Tax=Grosmannia clavigera (strain kw1407 / UAMH 11150) TaxID=655863 RepID=F0XHS5_GROCL|nr:udp-glucose 6-dehydrogenase [Grosmannia clavigera kw1407]EFX03012.1 udp-glucose 6-dehydrogenase [Grosmannia clavigera kw1407]